MSKITKLEQETIFLYNEAETQAEIFTYSKSLQRKLSGFCEKHPDEFSYKGDNGAGGQTFLCPKKRITVMAPRKLSPEQRDRAVQNLMNKQT